MYLYIRLSSRLKELMVLIDGSWALVDVPATTRVSLSSNYLRIPWKPAFTYGPDVFVVYHVKIYLIKHSSHAPTSLYITLTRSKTRESKRKSQYQTFNASIGCYWGPAAKKRSKPTFVLFCTFFVQNRRGSFYILPNMCYVINLIWQAHIDTLDSGAMTQRIVTMRESTTIK